MSATEQAENRKRDQKRRMGGTIGKMAKDLMEIADLPEPPSYETLIRLLGVQAMHGHVTAIRLLMEEYRRDGNGDESKTPLQVADELAQRRAS